MGIEVKITAENTDELHGQLAKLLAGAAPSFTSQELAQRKVGDDIEAIETAVRKPRGKKGTPEKEPEEGNAPIGSTGESSPSSTTSSTQTEAGPSDQGDESEIAYADVQKAVTTLAAARGRDAVVSVFKQFGVDHGTKLAPEQWPAAIDALTQAKEA